MTKSRIVGLFMLFLLLLILSLAATFPVRYVFHAFQPVTDVRVVGIEGTIFSTHIDTINVEGVSFDDVQVSLYAPCLFKLSVCYRFADQDERLRGQLGFELISQRLQLSNAYVELDQTVLSNLENTMVKPRGQIAANIDRVTQQNGLITELQGNFQWINAGIEGESQILGDYLASIELQGSQLLLNISDSDALLGANGEIRLNSDGNYSSELTFTGKAGLKPSIKSAIGLLARQTSLNEYQLKAQGRIPGQYQAMFNRISWTDEAG